jgi:hypothetical protein
MRKVIGVIGFASTMLISGAAAAAACAGFTDVDSASGFCPSVQWLRNRGITVGCTPTLYCPADAVTRLEMAAFMNRLGNALEPVFVHATEKGASAAVNTGDTVVCKTSPYAVTNYPRVATASTMFYHESGYTENVNTKVRYSTNGGTTWNDFGDFYSGAGNWPGALGCTCQAVAEKGLRCAFNYGRRSSWTGSI